jgi:hypothetical protein
MNTIVKDVFAEQATGEQVPITDVYDRYVEYGYESLDLRGEELYEYAELATEQAMKRGI